MIVPDGVVQAERLVALTPAVARALVLLDDDCRHTQLAEPCAKCNSSLAATDDKDIGLRRIAQLGALALALFFPGHAVTVMAVLGPIGRRMPFGSSWPFNSVMVVKRVQIRPSFRRICP